MSGSAQIGVTGLATMGRNLARNFARHRHTVALHNRTAAKTVALVEEFGGEGTFLPAEDMQSFVASLEPPRRAMIMVKAGGPTDAVIDELAPLMEPGDVIVDGGNAHFADTRRREAALRGRGIHFVGTGVSGGEEGALIGPSIMPGGTADVLGHTDADGRPFVDVVLDQAEQKGTGSWTVQLALDLGVPVSGIAEAVFARAVSGHAGQRAAARSLPGPAADGTVDSDGFVDDVRRALYASKVVAYAQGFDEITAGSTEYGWDIDRGAMATIWRGGCIIRARFLNRIKEAYDRDAGLPSLLVDDYFAAAVGEGQDAWRRVVATAATTGVPTPGFSSALAYYDALRAERLPAALIQGLRDLFGAHTYRRVDRDGVFHTLWATETRAEVAG